MAGIPSISLDPVQRRRIIALLVVSVALARSRSSFAAIGDTLNISKWRQERKRRREERRRRERETPLNTPALEKKMVDLYIRDPSGSRTLLVPHMGRISKVHITPTPQETYEANAKLFTPLQPGEKLGINKRFWQMLRAVLTIAIPGARSKEAFLLILHTFFLVARTYLSVLVARLDGRIVRDLVPNGPGFIGGLGWWFVLAVPSTYTNSMIRYLEHKLALAFRTNLTRYIHDIYLNQNLNYYKFGLGLGVVSGSSSDAEAKAEGRLTSEEREVVAGGADQLITTDLARFCDSLASLYGNMGKPFLDMVIFTSQLAASLGPSGTMGLFAQYYFTAWVLRQATPAFGRMAATEARLEGEYRTGLGRVGRDSEEIAFYDGGKRELGILWSAYLKLAKHAHSIFKVRIPYGMTEDFVIKYFWSAIGYGLMSIPVFFPVARHALNPKDHNVKDTTNEVAERTESYVSNRRLLLSLGDAGGRLMYSGKELAELSGYTSRVYSLLASLHSLDNNIYPENPRPASLPANEPFYDLSNVHGRVIIGPSHVLLKGVPIVAPAGGAAGAERGGEELIHSLDLRVEKGEHTLVTGANGVGKTAIARVIAQLWPTWTGLMERPVHGEGGIFFLPQRPYLSIGSLRDHPHTYAEMKARGRTDAELMSILEHVHLAYLPSREGGWETRKEWKDVFRFMGMARLFYHRPAYAVLDEATSAVSSDVEGLMYEHAKALGITLITISHRPSLLKYHNRHLRLGEPTLAPSLSTANLHANIGTPSTPLAAQGWQLTQMSSHTNEEKLELDKEIERLEQVLDGEVEQWERRLAEVNKELQGK
ncbi:ATP-binding cassette long-chain fatty acid transporter pxa1 [Vanrija albida]|uniref:ATP-binding cassette long-chain fatty acid transporter pxa1 n=1 Tax=Vanrija albida TaxID=181172 RepID=A0ABR3PXB5_9TREE